MQKSKGGRPPKYDSVEEVQRIVNEYLRSCEETGRPKRVAGLALALGFSSRQSLLNYQAKQGFMDVISRAKLECEDYAEEALYNRETARGAEFALQCGFGWGKDTAAKPVAEDDPVTAALKSIARGVLASGEPDKTGKEGQQ